MKKLLQQAAVASDVSFESVNTVGWKCPHSTDYVTASTAVIQTCHAFICRNVCNVLTKQVEARGVEGLKCNMCFVGFDMLMW